MNKATFALLRSLSFGNTNHEKNEKYSYGFVETLAGVYERARNALEYRADNLVRRAAIERILKRRIILNNDPKSLADHLLTELKWAKYISLEEIREVKKHNLPDVLNKYTDYLHGKVPMEWVVKIASAEIEELFNLNTDYKQFTFFAFQVMKQKVKIKDSNSDLLIYFACDKVYAGSDEEQIAFHILKLAGQDVTKEKLEEAWRLFNLAKKDKNLSRIIKFVRHQMPPLVLLRDIYFYDPSQFKESLTKESGFTKLSGEVLDLQLMQMSSKIKTAGIRSVIYVFLTKMILAFGMEMPFEIFFYGSLNKIPLALNLIFPPMIMWLTTISIHLPNDKEKEALIKRTWYILEHFEKLEGEDDLLTEYDDSKNHGIGYIIFSFLYSAFFIGVFAGILFVLGKIGYTIFSEVIFIFFLTVIAFFAYRIGETAKIYLWKAPGEEHSTFTDIISTPILAIGSRLSRGISRLNFLAFVFDFILEAPFKIILRFFDDWVQFLSIKREEQIIE